jgi:hypothetical protein
VETTGPKHDVTAVGTTKAAGANKLQSIEVGGSNETLEFGE